MTPDSLEPVRYRLLVGALTVLFVLVGLTWATLTTPFSNPDEVRHLNSALRLAYGGGWPEPGTQELSTVMLEAREQVGRSIPPDDERVRITEQNAHGEVRPSVEIVDVDQMTQHPPGYYAVAAAFLKVTGLDDARWDQALFGMRVLDVLMCAAIIPLIAAAGLRLTGSRRVGIVAATFPIGYVLFAQTTGTASNDPPLMVLGAAVTYFVVRVLTGDVRWRTVVALGAVQGLALFTKSIPLLALPMIAAAFAVSSGVRPLQRLWRGAVTMAVAFVVGGWWWARNLLTDGTIQPTGFETPAPPAGFEPDFGTYLVSAADLLLRRTIGDPTAFYPTRVAYVAAAIAVVLIVVAVTSRRTRIALVVLLSCWVLTMTMILVNSWGYYEVTGRLAALNGRYAFDGIAGIAIAVGLGLCVLLGRRWGRYAVVTAVSIAVALSAYGLWTGLHYYHGRDGRLLSEAVRRWGYWSPMGSVELAALLVLDVVAALTCVIVAAWKVRERPSI